VEAAKADIPSIPDAEPANKNPRCWAAPGALTALETPLGQGGRYQSIGRAKPVQQQKAARTTSTEEQNKHPILFTEFGYQVLRLCPLKKGITGFAFLCFASSPLETM
jgi:hypothetical protein